MKILDILSSPWAIIPEKLIELQNIYATHMRGDKIDVKGIEAAIGRPLDNSHAPYDVVNGVAVISLNGVIAKRMNLFSQISGGVSTELAAKELKAALNDSQVNAIILSIDSPGGTVDGTETLANLVRDSRDQKKIVTWANGMLASAAYWIGSGAEQIYMADQVTHVGSIGVVATHVDVSGAEQKAGLHTTEITAGRYKRIASQYAPLTDAGKQYIQEQVDQIYSVFVNAVADNRGATVDDVLANMADGRTFIGQQAIDAGLVDGVATLDALIAELSQQGAGDRRLAQADVIQLPATAGDNKTGDKTMDEITLEMVLSDAPEVAETLRAQGYENGHQAGMTEGAEQERNRIKAIEDLAMPGHEALVNGLKFDGQTTGEQAAVQILAAERELQGKSLKDRRDDAPDAADFTAAPDGEQAVDDGSLATSEDKAAEQYKASADLQKEFTSAGAYWAFCQAENKRTATK